MCTLNRDLRDVVSRNRQLRSLALGDSTYNTITFKVNNLNEFVFIIESLASIQEKHQGAQWLYRGEANSSWRMEPSVGRISKGLSLSRVEYPLCNEFYSEYPELFSPGESKFDILCKMQHYGIPTRLLDFTTNPLVALYFSSINLGNRDGRVSMILGNVHHPSDKCVELISEFPFIETYFNKKLDDFMNLFDYSVTDYIYDMYTDFYNRRPLFVRPRYIDARMRTQQSVFMIFPNILRDAAADKIYFHHQPSHFPRETIEEIYDEQINLIEESGCTFKILTLHNFELERIIDSYRQDRLEGWPLVDLDGLSTALTSRFLVQEELSDISDLLSSAMVSIIIPNNTKKKIIYQLSLVGINEAFLFPDAEHYASLIKKKVMNTNKRWLSSI